MSVSKQQWQDIRKQLEDGHTSFICNAATRVGGIELRQEVGDVLTAQGICLSGGGFGVTSAFRPEARARRIAWVNKQIAGFKEEKAKRAADKRDRLDDYVKRKARKFGLTIEESRLALANMDDNHKAAVKESKEFYLASAFVFSSSKEGSVYWWTVYNRVHGTSLPVETSP